MDYSTPVSTQIYHWSIGFIAILSFAIFFILKDANSVGLRILFLCDLALNHLFGALIYAAHWYEPTSAYVLHMRYGGEHILSSFKLVVWGAAAFVFGSLCVTALTARKSVTTHISSKKKKIAERTLTGPDPKKILIYSFLFLIIVAPFLSQIPSIDQLSGVAWKLIVCSLYVISLSLYDQGKWREFYICTILGVILFPAYTLFFWGFLSYGIAAALPLAILLLRQVKSTAAAVAIFLLGVFIGLSLFVNYFEHRTNYRTVAWQENGGAQEKIGELRKMFTGFQFFDVKNNDHLEAVDMRLNQNAFIGIGVERIDQGLVRPLKGETVWLSFAALIPRAIWPDKPEYGGSGSWVSIITGLNLSETSSFGLGNILEFYANFGFKGVLIGFFLLGIVIGKCDLEASMHRILPAPPWGFYLWFGVGFSLVATIGFLAELIGACWIYIMVVFALQVIFINRMQHRKN